LDAFGGFDGEVYLVYGPEDFVDFTNGGFVLEVYGRIEVWDFGID
jgi:hypothetical protein